MCRYCYEEYGSPKIINDNVLWATRLIGWAHEHHHAGGNLSDQFDGWHLDDEYFQEFKITQQHLFPGQLEAEQTCFWLLKRLTLDERVSALGLYDGYWSITQELKG